MNDDAFRQAVCAEPDDDTVRLAYADWLDEQGEARRAEFIRAGVRLAGLPEHDPFYQEVLAHRPDLIYGNDFQDLRSELPPGLDWPADCFRRGFPAAVDASGIPAFLDNAEQLFALAPIQHLELDGRHPSFARELARLADSPWLGRLRSLEIHLGNLGPKVMRTLGESPHARGLRSLALLFGAVGSRGLAALVGSSLFRRLVELNVSLTDYFDPIGPTFPQALERVKGPCRLAKLDLYMTRLGGEDAERLAECPALRTLTDLDAGGCSYDRMLGEAGVRALATSPHLAGLEVLRLAKTEPQLGGIRALAESTTLTRLRYLNLEDNRLGVRATELLADSPVLGQLTVLKLEGNKLGDRGVAALAGSPHLTRLAYLGLGDVNLGDEGARALLDSPNLANLVSLSLGSERSRLSPALKRAL